MSSTFAFRGRIVGSGSDGTVSRAEWIDGVVPLGVVTLSLIDTDGVGGVCGGGNGTIRGDSEGVDGDGDEGGEDGGDSV